MYDVRLQVGKCSRYAHMEDELWNINIVCHNDVFNIYGETKYYLKQNINS